MSASPKFDGLAAAYDRRRPRYPAKLLEAVAGHLEGDRSPLVIDAGAGTGIALEGIVPLLPEDARIMAVDISADMVATGRAKFPNVEWATGPAEPFLERFSGTVSLVVAAQAYQWMDRPRFLAAAHRSLREGGTVAILQNNRAHQSSHFLDAYERLLETYSPGYRRDYRAIDVESELREIFGDQIVLYTAGWSHRMTTEDFVEMSSSSTQVQRAITVEPGFLDRVRALANKHADDGMVEVAYQSEAFVARR